MKKVNGKTLMVLTIFLTSIFAIPIMGSAKKNGEEPPDKEGVDPRMFGDALRDFDAGGMLLADIFEVLFMQTLELEKSKMLDGVYVLNASKETVHEGTYDFALEGDSEECHWLPYVHNETSGENIYLDEYKVLPNPGWAYCKVQKSGSFNYTLTVGASINLLIWDYDGSFIRAATKIIDFAKELHKNPTEETLINKGIPLASWLLLHINDIFTGDELFVFNPITWQKLDITPLGGFDITKDWYDFGPNGFMEWGGGDDVAIPLGLRQQWNNSAKNPNIRDSYMQWLLSAEMIPPKIIWTQFHFDLFQLWMKNFEIHIDLGAISKAVGGEQTNFAKVFSGLDIEFYLFHHHLEAAFLYNDIIPDGQITVDWVEQKYPNGTVIEIDGETAMRPNTTEITHRLMLGDVDKFVPKDPEADGDDSVVWGVTLKDAVIRCVPTGVDLNSYLSAPDESLSFIDFNLRFTKFVEPSENPGEFKAKGEVKLQHNFAPWNDPVTPAPNAQIGGLDLAIVYVSHIFHFHLNVKADDESKTPEDDLEDDYEAKDHSLKIGNYIDEGADLDLVDIAGPKYKQGPDTNDNGKPDDGQAENDANSAIVPIGLFTFEGEKKTTHTGDIDEKEDDFSTDVNLEVSLNRMYYGVFYPNFDGTGEGIWHDPTFNIYMVFTPEGFGVLTLILLIAGIGLVGLAAILIKRRKDSRF